MDDRIPMLCVALLDSGSLDHIAALLDNVEFDEAIVPLGLRDCIQLILVQSVHIANVSEPGVQNSHVRWHHGRLSTTLSVSIL